MKWKPVLGVIAAVVVVLLITAASVQPRTHWTEPHAEERAQPVQPKKESTGSNEYEYREGPQPEAEEDFQAPPESNVEPKWVKHRLTGMDQLICPTSVQATVGESVTLDFHFKSQLDVTSELIEWKFNNSIRVLVFRSRGVSKDQADQFRSRASLLSADDVSKGKLAVKISALTRMDVGMYSCFVGRGGTKRSCSVELIIPDQKGIIQNLTSAPKPSSEERVKPEVAIVVKFLVCVVSLSAVIVLIKTWIRAS